MPGGKGCLMPKNQFQRPLPVTHDRKVPRHGKPQPTIERVAVKPVVQPSGGTLPPLSQLLQHSGQK